MNDLWVLILDIVIVLGAAALFGVVAERIRLGSVLGYLIAGVVVGPGLLNLVKGGEVINVIAEMGVALLLFTIGLEFSWKRLVGFGGRAVIGGAIALVSIITVFTALGLIFGLDWRAALVIGSAASLGSTAIVIRILKSQYALDTGHGRFSLALLLTQDIALIPLVLIVSFLAGEQSDIVSTIGSTLINTSLLVLGMILFVSLVIPRLLDEKVIAKNREIPILIAITTAIGATWAAHAMGLSPALGAFVAGLILAEGRFADQMRADALPLRTLFMTVFFVSIGLFADLEWMGANIGLVLGATALLILAKATVTYLSIRPFRVSIVEAMATAIAVAQVGEFSFVLLDSARGNGLLDLHLFKLATSVTLLTLLITPIMTGNAYRIALRVSKTLVPKRKLAQAERRAHHQHELEGHVVVVGFGAAGRAAAATLADEGESAFVLEINPQLVRQAQQCGHGAIIGDASQYTNIERANIALASAVIVTVPDNMIARTIVNHCKNAAPDVPVIARSRYHIFYDELNISGADMVVDEEQTVGLLLGSQTLNLIRGKTLAEPGDEPNEPF